MKKSLRILFLLFICFDFAFAQDEDLSTTHKSSERKNNSASTEVVDSKNAIYVNVGPILRGGATIGYERYLGSIFSVYGEFGTIVNDYVGRYSLLYDKQLQELDSYNFTMRDEYRFGRIYTTGLKMYVEKQMKGFYFGLEYTNVNILSFAQYSGDYLNNGYQIIGIPANSIPLPYVSNEYKFNLGASDGVDNIYFDFNLGFGIRRVAYREINNINLGSFYTSNTSSNSYYYFSYQKKDYTQIKPWIFMNVKLGYQF